MQVVKTLDLDSADKIANLVLECVKRNEFRPCNVLVTDSAGDALVFKKADGTGPLPT